ncbi:MAG: alcohol dehydrogenase, partial [Acidobacteria bacterium]|nr:alcohol dehydrogenase [Acidobacteriota bacterium]
MKAVLYENFLIRPVLCDVLDPEPSIDGVVLEVRATGVCR